MHVPMLLRRQRPVVAVLVLSLIGCAGPLDPTTRPAIPAADGPSAGSHVRSGMETGAAGPASQAGFYPLRVGNRWDYLQGVAVGVVPDSGPAPPFEITESVIRREIVDVQEVAGRDYLLEQITEEGPGVRLAWVIYSRQDVSGLYEFDPRPLPQPAGGSPPEAGPRPARAISWMNAATLERLLEGRSPTERDPYLLAARRLDDRIGALRSIGGQALVGRRFPGTAAAFELTRLRYPLEPKSRWEVRTGDAFPLTAEVIAAERVRVGMPPGSLRGHRISLRSGLFGPNDYVDVWYGPAGFLGLVAHLESVATDAGGVVIGRWIYNQGQLLTGLRLPGSEIVPLPPWFELPRK